MKKKTLRNKCDKLVAEKVRSLGRCEVCGRQEGLCWVHFISRGVIKLRYHKKNNGCICDRCHKLMHNSPKWATVQWDIAKGSGTTAWLEREQHKLRQISIKFYEDIIAKFS